MIITLSKSGTKERTIDVGDIQITDLWHVALRANQQDAVAILGVWFLAHDMLNALRELDQCGTEL